MMQRTQERVRARQEELQGQRAALKVAEAEIREFERRARDTRRREEAELAAAEAVSARAAEEEKAAAAAMRERIARRDNEWMHETRARGAMKARVLAEYEERRVSDSARLQVCVWGGWGG